MARKVIVAVHGIGDQFRYETIQSVTNQVCHYFGLPAAVPLGKFYSELFVAGPDVSTQLTALTTAVAALPANLKAGVAAAVAAAAATPGATAAAVAAAAAPGEAGLKLTWPGPQLPADFGFAEVYWADVPRGPIRDGHTLEEAKRWARTIVERVRLQYLSPNKADRLPDEGYEVAATVLEEMIQTVAVLDRLSFLAEQAGVFRFDLKKVLDDYLGDVQIVTEFAPFRDKILKSFDTVMERVAATWDGDAEPPEVYIVAHSEGTVITFLGLLHALARPAADRPPWVTRVRGLMTIGSPINKHIILWPELWGMTPGKGDLATDADGRPVTIAWRNYYDYGDPVGFELKKTREWLGTSGFARFFDFADAKPGGPRHDFGFARYPFPGKAHIDYWDDAVVFGHFITTVVKPEVHGQLVPGPHKGAEPGDLPFRNLVSVCVPYLVALVLCFLGMYLVYKGVHELTGVNPGTSRVARDVTGLTGLFAAFVVIARIPRLVLRRKHRALSWLLLAAAAGLYAWAMTEPTLGLLSLGWPPGLHDRLPAAPPAWLPWWPGWVCDWLPYWTPLRVGATLEMTAVVAALAVLVRLAGYLFKDYGGTRTIALIGLGATGAFVTLVSAQELEGKEAGPVWPLLLALAACFYLWWLAAMIFDLAFVWHRYVRHSVIELRLGGMARKDENYHRLVDELVERLKADGGVAAAAAGPERTPFGEAVLVDAYAAARERAARETGKSSYPTRCSAGLAAAVSARLPREAGGAVVRDS